MVEVGGAMTSWGAAASMLLPTVLYTCGGYPDYQLRYIQQEENVQYGLDICQWYYYQGLECRVLASSHPKGYKPQNPGTALEGTVVGMLK